MMPSVFSKPDTSDWTMSNPNVCSVCCSAIILFFSFHVSSKQTSYKLKCWSVLSNITLLFLSHVAITSVKFI